MNEPAGWTGYVVPVAIFVLVLTMRLRRMSREQPLRIERLWIFPAVYLVICIGLLVEFPPTMVGWGICVLSLSAGAALGWQRGKTMRITIDPETHALSQRASVAGLAFILVIIAVRAGLRAESAALHLNVAMLTDALVVFALGLFSAQRLEMYLRAKRLIAGARH